MAGKNKRLDYVPHGSAQHATLLGLTKATEAEVADAVEVTLDGWKLTDPTPLIMTDPTGRLEKIILRQMVNELTAPTPEIQSDDPTKPGYAPPLWQPPEDLRRKV